MNETKISGSGDWNKPKADKNKFNKRIYSREEMMADATPEERAKLEAAYAAIEGQHQKWAAIKSAEEQTTKSKPEEIREGIRNFELPSKKRNAKFDVMMMDPEESKKLQMELAARMEASKPKESALKKWVKNLFS